MRGATLHVVRPLAEETQIDFKDGFEESHVSTLVESCLMLPEDDDDVC